jgi:hypothetical protein
LKNFTVPIVIFHFFLKTSLCRVRDMRQREWQRRHQVFKKFSVPSGAQRSESVTTEALRLTGRKYHGELHIGAYGAECNARRLKRF